MDKWLRETCLRWFGYVIEDQAWPLCVGLRGYRSQAQGEVDDEEHGGKERYARLWG